MNKIVKNTIIIIALILLAIVFVLNILVTASISNDVYEIVTVKANTVVSLLLTVAIAIGIIILCKKIDGMHLKKRTQIIIFASLLAIYLLVQCGWLNIRKATPVADQLNVYEAARDIYENNWEELKSSKYLELYPQQLTLAVMYSIVFRVSGVSIEALQCLNVIANLFTILALALISKLLLKDYQVNLVKTVILSMTFISLPMLAIFIYGDFISLPMCLFAIYFMMKYTIIKKKEYAIFSGIFMAMAYILRMNSLIYLLALVCYLILDVLEENTVKKVLGKIVIILLFIAISVFPANIIKNILQTKLEHDKDNVFPATGFIYMGMEQGRRANGWFEEKIAFFNRNNIELAKQEYKKEILNRGKYLLRNPIEAMQFYTMKTSSMWTENTYSAVWYNLNFNFTNSVEEKIQTCLVDINVLHSEKIIAIYQKALIWIIFASSILVILKYKGKLSKEVLLLLIVFIGGFLFHTIWEAKSRYIIPYILVLIPVSAIVVEREKVNFKKIWRQK